MTLQKGLAFRIQWFALLVQSASNNGCIHRYYLFMPTHTPLHHLPAIKQCSSVRRLELLLVGSSTSTLVCLKSLTNKLNIRCFNSRDDKDAVVFTGRGVTGAINHLIKAMRLWCVSICSSPCLLVNDKIKPGQTERCQMKNVQLCL